MGERHLRQQLTRLWSTISTSVTIKPDIHRVVSLVPTNSEMVCLLECDRLVGTRYDIYRGTAERMLFKQMQLSYGSFDITRKDYQLADRSCCEPAEFTYAQRIWIRSRSLWPHMIRRPNEDFTLLGELLGQQQKRKG